MLLYPVSLLLPYAIVQKLFFPLGAASFFNALGFGFVALGEDLVSRMICIKMTGSYPLGQPFLRRNFSIFTAQWGLTMPALVVLMYVRGWSVSGGVVMDEDYDVKAVCRSVFEAGFCST